MDRSNILKQADAVKKTLSSLRIPFSNNEYQLHQWIAAALRDGGFVVQHEVSLAPRCRIDFLIDSIGIEVKRGKPRKADLLAQCARYLRSERVDALIVVLDTAVSLPRELEGKPLIVFGLNKLWGIAL
jgi:hypothetical protein